MELQLFRTYSPTQISILRTVFERKSASRSNLADSLGVSSLTVLNNIRGLMEDGVLMENGTLPSARGRKVTLLSVNPDFRYFVAVDIGSNSTKLAVIRMDGSILSRNQIIRTSRKNFFEAYITPDVLRNEIDRLMDHYGRERFCALCFCISGVVDYAAKSVRYSANIPGWNDVSFEREFGSYFHLPVYLDSSGHCFALAERQFGQGRGADSMMAISIGCSICTGIIMNGRLMRGASGSAGELGHICVSDNPYARGYTDRLACTCGHIGCMEMFVTLPMIRWAVVQKMEEVESIHVEPGSRESRNVYTISWLKRAYEDGVPYVVETVAKAAHILGTELANTANLLNPSVLVLGGGTIGALPDIVKIVEEDVKKNSLEIISDDLRVVSSALGPDAPLLGAFLLAANDLYRF